MAGKSMNGESIISDVAAKALKASGFERPNPVQQSALEAGLLDGKNLVVAAPTASGKTLIAEIAALNTIMKLGRKVVYIVPLRALASEKFEEFRRRYDPMGIRVALSMGDLDRTDSWLERYDLIIVTSEKMDSMLRRGIPWIRDVGLVVADEIHLMDSPNRGPTLEIVLTRLRQVADPTILALSATISNHEELAEWLDADHIKTDWRPVKLYSGICFDGLVDFQPKRTFSIPSPETPLRSLVDNTLQKGKQALVFVNTRRGAESAAEKLGAHIKKKLNTEDAKDLKQLSERMLKILERPTAQCRRLSACIASGTTFHHAGLTNKQRSLIEQSFKAGTIKFICATPTLAAGVNLPAYRTIIRDLKRFSSFKGMDFLPILEAQQMAGRAGRPSYDKEGEAIFLPKNRAEAEYAWENYINGEPEKIYSKLGVEPVLRTHVLALIASGATSTKKELMDFFFKTFYAHQYKDLSKIEGILNKVIGMLRDFEFIEGDNPTADKRQREKQKHQPGNEVVFKKASRLLQKENETLRPTKIGRRVAELYLDPITAYKIITSLKTAHESKKPIHAFPIIHLASNTMEMRPLMNMRKPDYEEIEGLLTAEEKALLETPPSQWDIGYDDFLRSIKTAHVLNQWAEEHGEDQLLEKYGATPGEMHARLNNIDWLLYSMQELTLLLGHKEQQTPIRKVRIRIKYGVKEELLPLVRIKGIGRARARKLWNSNVRSLKALRDITMVSLSGIVGLRTAESIKNQLGEMTT
jgi:helicase